MAVRRGRPSPRSEPVGFRGTTYKIKRYGWVPDLPDQRDHTYAVAAPMMATIPASVDLRHRCPSVYDQGELGSCTANAIAAALEFDMMGQGMPHVSTPSRLFIYYNERVMEGTVNSDSGAQIRDGIKSVASQGDCPETEWPYDIAKFAVQPSKKCYTDAVKHKALIYQTVARNLADMRGCLASGFPFVFGFTVYESFESPEAAKTGDIPAPHAGEKALGGHAVLAVGYDDEEKVFIVRNSWADTWGDAGYCYMPYSYLIDDNLADDFWTIRVVQ